MLSKIMKLIDVMISVLILVERLLRVFVWRFTVRPAGFGKRVQVKETGLSMAKIFTYMQGLLTPPAGVDKQRIIVSVDGTDQEPQLLESSATEATIKVGPEGANVKLSLDYLDAAGNDSANFEDTFIVADEIPPEAPLGFGTRVQIAEEDAEVPAEPEA